MLTLAVRLTASDQGLTAELAGTEKELQQIEAASRRAGQGAEALARSEDQAAGAVGRIGRQVLPTTQALDRLGRESADSAAQVDRLGRESAEAGRGLQQLVTGANAAAAANENLARTATRSVASTRSFGAVAQQAGFQVGDFAVQVASGGNAMTAFVQQGSQLLGFFGPWGAIIGAAVAVLGALATGLGVMGDEADAAEQALRRLEDAIDAGTEALEAHKRAGDALTNTRAQEMADLADLARLYQHATEEAREFYRVQLEGQASEIRVAQAGLTSRIRERGELLADILDQVTTYRGMVNDPFAPGGVSRMAPAQAALNAIAAEVSAFNAAEEPSIETMQRLFVGLGDLRHGGPLSDTAIQAEGGRVRSVLEEMASTVDEAMDLIEPAVRDMMSSAEKLEAIQQALDLLGMPPGEREAFIRTDPDTFRGSGGGGEGARNALVPGMSDVINSLAPNFERDQSRFAAMIRRGQQLTEALRTPMEVYRDTVAELNELLAAGAINQETFRRGLAEADEQLRKATGSTIDWEAGWRSLGNWAGKTLSEIRRGAFDAAEALESLADIIFQTLVINPFQNALASIDIGELIGSAFGSAATAHSGGIVGSHGLVGGGDRRVVPMSAFRNAPRFHRGGQAGLAPGEVPIIAKQGEIIGWPAQLARAFGGAAPVTVNVIDQRRVAGGETGGPGIDVSQSIGPDGERQIDILVLDAVGRLAESGQLHPIMGQVYGARPRGVG